jgi:hypothetical protein
VTSMGYVSSDDARKSCSNHIATLILSNPVCPPVPSRRYLPSRACPADLEPCRRDPYAATDGGFHRCVAFRNHPVQDESVEQPWADLSATNSACAAAMGRDHDIATRAR